MRLPGYRSVLASAAVGAALACGLLAAGRGPAAVADSAAADSAAADATPARPAPLAPVLADGDGAQFFDAKIRPIFERACYECHAGEKHKGGLKMDTRENLLAGGEDGPAVVPGKPEESFMMKAIRWDVKDDDQKMPPPKGKKKFKKLTDAEIADVAKWIEMGVPYSQGK